MKNTPENIDKAIAILQAMKRGETIQFRDPTVWLDWPSGSETNLLDFYHGDYRVKPAPVKRLIKVEELPEVIWLFDEGAGVRQVVGDDGGVLIYAATSIKPLVRCCIEELHHQGILWSPSRRGPWYSFEMTDEELQKIKEGK